MNKKAQGLSMNVIIIAAIALLVLIILIVLVINAGERIKIGTGCMGSGGRCAGDCSDEGPGFFSDPGNNDCPEGEMCCRTITREET